MTRQEEIKKAATAKSRGETPYYYDAFIAGAEWADENPQDPWISVEDDMPALFCFSRDRADTRVQFILYCDEDGEYYLELPQNEDVKITHWMAIPCSPPLFRAFEKYLDSLPKKGGEQ